jgi:hypothetical protein
VILIVATSLYLVHWKGDRAGGVDRSGVANWREVDFDQENTFRIFRAKAR